MSPRLLTVKQYAEAVQLSEDTITRHIRRGLIKAMNVGTPRRHIYRIPASLLDVAA